MAYNNDPYGYGGRGGYDDSYGYQGQNAYDDRYQRNDQYEEVDRDMAYGTYHHHGSRDIPEDPYGYGQRDIGGQQQVSYGQSSGGGGGRGGASGGGNWGWTQDPYGHSHRDARRKSLLIGINYTGSQHALQGCQSDVDNVARFLSERGYPNDPQSQVILRDDRRGQFYPTGRNMLAAMDWLVSEPGTINFLHYSGHGGTQRAPERRSGFDDTIVPVDFETNGQIDSDTLHRHLVSNLPPSSTLFVVFDCCHSGSAIELPFVYRTDDDGNISMIDNFKAGMQLIGEASDLLSGGLRFDPRSLNEAKTIYSGARSLFNNLKAGFDGSGGQHEAGVQAQNDFGHDWSKENKNVTMFSGCKDDQTSADANIMGLKQGAMSWAFLSTMRQYPEADYVTVLQDTRQRLRQSQYQQVPQLSVGYRDFNIQQPIYI